MDKKIGKFKGIPTTESGMPVPIIAEYRLRKFTLNCRKGYIITMPNPERQNTAFTKGMKRHA